MSPRAAPDGTDYRSPASALRSPAVTSSRRALSVLLLALCLNANAGRRSALEPPDLVEKAERKGLNDRAAAIADLERYLAGTPDPEIAPWAAIWAGEEHRLAGNPAKARTWFERAAERYPTHPLKNAAVLGMALVDAGEAPSGNTAATLQLIDDEGVPATMNADRYRLLARLGQSEGSPPGRVREYARKAVTYAKNDPEVAARVQTSLADILSNGEAPAPPATAAAALSEVRASLARGDLEATKAQAAALIAQYADSAEAQTAEALLLRAQHGDPATANRVGVLLPLSGEYALPGKHMREAIELANVRDGSPLDLVFVDTAGDATRAVAALDELVTQKGCVAVMGPLLKPELTAVEQRAQRLEVPLITLSQYSDATVGDYVYSGFLTLDQQVDALLDYAMTTQGLTNFAVAYPENSYGEAARDAFVTEAQKRGASVTRVESYDPDANSFLELARRLGQKDYKAQAAELARLRAQAKARGIDPDKVTLPPNVDFQALFVPDNARRSSLVASSLAYEEFAIGTFKPKHEDVTIKLLGLNGWNSQDLVEAGGKYMRGSIFVDAFLESDPGAASFIQGFKSAENRDPMVLDAMAYDATRLVAQAVKAGGKDRAVIRDQLSQARIKGPITRGDHFSADREVERELYVLTLSAQGIVPASTEILLPGDPPPEP